MIVSYKWLVEYLGLTAPTREDVESLLTFHSFEIEGSHAVGDDVAIDIKVLPNRGSDCLSHRGIAREIASLTGTPLAFDPLSVSPTLPQTNAISISITDTHACPRFSAALVEGVTVGESPAWLVERLRTLGQRSINNVVDATNYVMYAIGQPLHAYDADLFPQGEGSWQFGVRFGVPGETVSLLAEGGKQEARIITCTGSELLIVDNSSNTPIGLAGVKGGTYAGVHSGTKNIIIEAAHFDPVVTRKTARRLGIVIDASKRFENRPAPELTTYALRDCVELISAIASGTLVGIVDQYSKRRELTAVPVSPLRVNGLLGLSLPISEIVAILSRAGVTVVSEGDMLLCTGPFERTDLTIEADFIEEVGRLHGFAHVASVVPEPTPLTEYNPRHYYSEQIRDTLLSLGFSEVITSSFRSHDEVQLQNSLASDKSYLRSKLSKNIEEVLDKNVGLTDLLGTSDTRVFEIGTVFTRGDNGVIESLQVAIGARVKVSGYSGKEDMILNSAIAALEELLGTKITSTPKAGIAEFSLSALLPVLPKPTAYAAVEPQKDTTYRPFSVYPSIRRDIALWVDSSSRATVEALLTQHAGTYLARVTFLDEFTKDGKTSFAFRLVFQAPDRTLTDEVVEAAMTQIYTAVSKAGYVVR
jgi:phenylalanyl-tRNA synthetase beta chain